MGSAIGSGYVIIVPPLDPSGVFTGDVAAAEQECIRILKKLSALARPYGMKLCFELVGLRKSCVRSIEAADRIVRAVGEDNAGFVFDSYNIYLNGRCNDFSAIKNVQPEKIFAIHLMSADDVPESEMGQDKRCFAGTGGRTRKKRTGLDGNNGRSAERTVVKSTNRIRNDSDFALRQPTDQKAGSSNPSRRTKSPRNRLISRTFVFHKLLFSDVAFS